MAESTVTKKLGPNHAQRDPGELDAGGPRLLEKVRREDREAEPLHLDMGTRAVLRRLDALGNDCGEAQHGGLPLHR